MLAKRGVANETNKANKLLDPSSPFYHAETPFRCYIVKKKRLYCLRMSLDYQILPLLRCVGFSVHVDLVSRRHGRRFGRFLIHPL
jgi:hypothetical protein